MDTHMYARGNSQYATRNARALCGCKRVEYTKKYCKQHYQLNVLET